MNRASPVELRKCLEAARMLAEIGIRFVPMPVESDAEHEALSRAFIQKMERLATKAEEEGGAA